MKELNKGIFLDQTGIFSFLHFILIFSLYEKTSLWYIADSYLKIQNRIDIDESHVTEWKQIQKAKTNDRKQSEENMRLMLFHEICLLPQEMLLLWI